MATALPLQRASASQKGSGLDGRPRRERILREVPRQEGGVRGRDAGLWQDQSSGFYPYEDDIFVAVAVGNHFSTNNPLALGYPASSTSVVPIGSVNSSGLISSFSQRNERILAAPGLSSL